MSVVSDILKDAIDVGDVVEKIGNVADALSTSTEEKNNHKLKMLQEVLSHKRLMAQNISSRENSIADNVTKRWQADYGSDNKLSKNVRPGVLVVITIFLIAITILDSAMSKFSVSSEWIAFWKFISGTVYFAYFGSRGLEKMVNDYTTSKEITPAIYQPPGGTSNDIRTIENEIAKVSQEISAQKASDRNTQKARYQPPIESLK